MLNFVSRFVPSKFPFCHRRLSSLGVIVCGLCFLSISTAQADLCSGFDFSGSFESREDSRTTLLQLEQKGCLFKLRMRAGMAIWAPMYVLADGLWYESGSHGMNKPVFVPASKTSSRIFSAEVTSEGKLVMQEKWSADGSSALETCKDASAGKCVFVDRIISLRNENALEFLLRSRQDGKLADKSETPVEFYRVRSNGFN